MKTEDRKRGQLCHGAWRTRVFWRGPGRTRLGFPACRRAHNVIASLRDATDASTEQLMDRFCDELDKGAKMRLCVRPIFRCSAAARSIILFTRRFSSTTVRDANSQSTRLRFVGDSTQRRKSEFSCWGKLHAHLEFFICPTEVSQLLHLRAHGRSRYPIPQVT